MSVVTLKTARPTPCGPLLGKPAQAGLSAVTMGRLLMNTIRHKVKHAYGRVGGPYYQIMLLYVSLAIGF